MEVGWRVGPSSAEPQAAATRRAIIAMARTERRENEAVFLFIALRVGIRFPFEHYGSHLRVRYQDWCVQVNKRIRGRKVRWGVGLASINDYRVADKTLRIMECQKYSCPTMEMVDGAHRWIFWWNCRLGHCDTRR